MSQIRSLLSKINGLWTSTVGAENKPLLRKGRFRFEVVRGMEGLLKLAPKWRELTQKVKTPRHFHNVEWFLALSQTMEQFGDPGSLYIAIYEAGELVGVVPLRVVEITQHKAKLKALRLLSNIRETPATRDLILAESVTDTDILVELVHFLEHWDDAWDVLILAGVMEDSCAMAAFQKATSLPSRSMPGGACGRVELILCGSDDLPFRQPSKSFRQNLRTSNNKLFSKDAHFVCAHAPDQLAECYPKLVAVEASGWKRNESSSIANHPQFDAFLRQLIAQLGPMGGCEIHLMQLGDLTIGGMICVVLNDICFIHVIAYDESYYQLSPGHLLLENLIKTRGHTGRIKAVTPYHAPDWFSAWKAAQKLTVSDIHLFRPSRRGEKLHQRLSKKD